MPEILAAEAEQGGRDWITCCPARQGARWRVNSEAVTAARLPLRAKWFVVESGHAGHQASAACG
jgi:hypothetical protein